MKLTVKAKRLEELTAIAKRGLEESARAVFEIHENKLYLEKYETFEEWLSQELGLKRTRGYELIDSYKGLQKLSSVELTANVRNSGHEISAHAAQAVSKIPEEHVAAVMDKATEGGTKPATAAAVKRVAAEFVPETPQTAPEPSNRERDLEAFRKAKSAAKQHNGAMVRFIDTMNELRTNPGLHRKALQHFEALDKIFSEWSE
jgi:hypothetical protein